MIITISVLKMKKKFTSFPIEADEITNDVDPDQIPLGAV